MVGKADWTGVGAAYFLWTELYGQTQIEMVWTHNKSTGLAKMIPQGTVQGGRRKGRQKKRWGDNISEGTGLELGEALRKAEDREEWRKVVARSS